MHHKKSLQLNHTMHKTPLKMLQSGTEIVCSLSGTGQLDAMLFPVISIGDSGKNIFSGVIY